MFPTSAPTVTVFVLYASALIGTGLWAYTRTRTLADFAIGGRRLGPVVSALSAGASDMSCLLLLALRRAGLAAGNRADSIAVGPASRTSLKRAIVAPRLL